MIYTVLTKKAMRIMFSAHKDQTDKTGIPYVFHPFHLAEGMSDEYTAAAALLHDVVEDTDITFDDLLREGIPEKVVDALRLLTHEEGTDYFDYVRRIKQNPIAAAVKYADLCHNSDFTRFAGEEIDEWARARGEKYEKAKKILLED